MTNQMTKLKKEIIIKIVLTLLLLALTVIAVTFAENQFEMKYKRYVVETGDTLWGLAASCSDRISLPDAIKIIRERNHIIGSTIYSGQMIELPIFDK